MEEALDLSFDRLLMMIQYLFMHMLVYNKYLSRRVVQLDLLSALKRKMPQIGISISLETNGSYVTCRECELDTPVPYELANGIAQSV